MTRLAAYESANKQSVLIKINKNMRKKIISSSILNTHDRQVPTLKAITIAYFHNVASHSNLN